MDFLEEINEAIEKAENEPLPEWSHIPKEARICFVLNNFHTNLPFGRRRKMTEQMGWMDNPRYGEKGKTPRQFYADIDNAVQQAGVDLKQIEDLQRRGKDRVTQGNLLRLTIPVYLKLREMGYDYSDLCA